MITEIGERHSHEISELVTQDGGVIHTDKTLFRYAEEAPEGLRKAKEYQPVIKGRIEASELDIGLGVVVEDGAEIVGERIYIGDFTYIGKDVQMRVPEITVGDFTTIHARSTLHGRKPLNIGSKCWFGNNVRMDSQGGLDIGNGVGAGDNSSIWTHAQFGDLANGLNPSLFSRWHTVIPDDVWLVGETKVHKAQIAPMSVFLEGTIVRGKNIAPNHIYGENMRDMTEILGTQFVRTNWEDKLELMKYFLSRFEKQYPLFAGEIQIAMEPREVDDNKPTLIVKDRSYTRRYNEAILTFIRKAGPLIKYYPQSEIENTQSMWGSPDDFDYTGEFNLEKEISRLDQYEIF